MRPFLLTGAALLMATSSVAFAQNTTVPAGQSAPSHSLPVVTSGSAGSRTASGMQTDAGGLFANVPAQADLMTKVVGLSVHNSENTNLGTIKDIAFDANGVSAYILSVGGFLGMGDHYVAVRPSAINIRYDITNNKWQASMNTDADQLKAAPAFKYSSAG